MNSPPSNVKVSRWIGKFEKNDSSPSIIILSGIHGNELSGVNAIEHVFSILKEKNIPIKGNIYGLRGNLKAIEQGKRFIDVDLNRCWTEQRIQDSIHKKNTSESIDVVAIKEIIDGYIQNAKAPLFLVDLHTTSSTSPPFVVLDDTIRNRNFADALSATKVLGVLEQLKGTVLGYYGDKGPVTLVFEAGQHIDKNSLKRHIAAVWLLLVKSGIIDEKYVDVNGHRLTLKNAQGKSPLIVESTYRHVLEPTDYFEMKPGFENFSPIIKGDLIAHQNRKPIHATKTANIFMPLYQSQGEDGFFIVRRISPFWVNLSQFLRKWKVDNLLSILPGIHNDPDNKDSFIINQKVASYKSIELLRLFGFRMEDKRGQFTFVSKRPYDFKGPWDK